MIAAVVLSNIKQPFMEITKALMVKTAKSFPVTAEQLYNAWTNPDQLKQWWKPMGNSLKEVINDLKQGGTVRYIFNDNKLVISGEYLEVKENEKLVYTWKWELPHDAVRNAEYKLAVNFVNKGDGSEINVLQENFETEESMLPHQEGWEKGLNDLENFLTSNTSTENIQNQEQNADGESEGYREDPEQVKVGGAEV